MDIKNTFFNVLKSKSKYSEQEITNKILKDFYFYQENDFYGHSFLSILAGGKISFPSPVSYSLNPFPSYLLFYTISGRGNFLTNGNSYPADNRHLIFFDCTRPFSIAHTDRNWQFYLFLLSGSALSSYYNIFHEVYEMLYPIPSGSCIPALLSDLAAMPETVSAKTALLCNKKLTDIFTEITLSALTQSDTAKPVPNYLLTMKEAFDQHYDQEYSLAYFEETTGISRYRLCREFSAAFSISPLQYLNQKRMEAAKELLLNSDMPVHEVGSAVGIDNTNHFINLFKKNTGTTPFVFKQEVPASIRELRSLCKPGVLPPR